ncbi:MAG: SpoIIE family protein phosphatase [Acidobacteria bacterium]|nr:SpoIIE family protein phosphatase [Acidobacteriota bacterium]
MPRVALAAGILLVLCVLLSGQPAIAGSFIGTLLHLSTAVTILLTIVYYGNRLLQRMADVLLWRVRRRLIVTYLFIGITPIVLLTVLACLAVLAVSAEAMTRTISVQINLLVNQASAGAEKLASALEESPSLESEDALREWAAERLGLLESTLPAARLFVWALAPHSRDPEPWLGQPVVVVGEVAKTGEKVASPTAPVLPEWLNKTDRWAGLAYDQEEAGIMEFSGFTVIRALARGNRQGRPTAVLLEVPAGPSLIERLRQSTGLEIYSPVTLGIPVGEINIDMEDSATAEPEVLDVDLTWAAGPETGMPLSLPYPVLMRATKWSSGEEVERNILQFRWTWLGAINYLLGLSLSGRIWRVALISVGGLFLALELGAILAALWMTRSVTSAVHGMHRATGFIRRGDFSHRIYLKSRDQLGDLAEAFNDMAAHVESLLEERVEKEALQREVEIAAKVQAGLFPREVPLLENVEIAGECRAARGVAGDYYDFIQVAPGQLLLAVGDVSGKGISASLLMSNVQASLRSLAGAAPVTRGGNGVAQIVKGVSDQLCRSSDPNRFASLFLARYEKKRHLLTYTNAGHCAPILLGADGTVQRLTAGGMIAGSFEDALYEETEVKLSSGMLLVLFSDGISEAQTSQGDQYGEDQLIEFVSQHRHLGAGDLQELIFKDVEDWTGGGDRDDDQTLVIVKTQDA